MADLLWSTVDVCCCGLTTIQGSTLLIGVNLSEPHTSGTALRTWHVYAWTDHLSAHSKSCQCVLQLSRVGYCQTVESWCKNTRTANMTQAECICSMHGNFQISLCYESGGCEHPSWDNYTTLLSSATACIHISV